MGYTLNFNPIWDNWDKLVMGLALALLITVVSLFVGAIIGLLAAFARTSGNAALSRVAGAYVEIMRNVPFLLVIFFVYFGFPTLVPDQTSSLVVAMAVYSGAYMTEIFRAGILAVSKGYLEAGKSIGLTNWQVIRFVTLPIMFRVVLPSLSNTLIGLFKDTSLGSAISVPELTYRGMVINTNYWRIIESWTAVGALYLVTCYSLAYFLRRIERRFAQWA